MGKTDYTKQVLANLNLESKVIKNLTVTSNTPVWLAEGELLVNIIDKKLWVGNTLNTPILILSPLTAAAANALVGTTLATNVVFSSLTSVGTLSTLTVTGTIVGNISGNAATATALTNTLPISGGGTGQVTVKPALNALLPSQAAQAGKYLRTEGVNAFWDDIYTTAISSNDLVGPTLSSSVLNSSLTSVGTLASLTVTNTIVGSISGNAATATSSATATSATTAGTVTTAAQPAITSVGTLTSVSTSGVITGTNTTASTSSTTGAIIIAGGAGFAKDININGVSAGIGAGTNNTKFGKNAQSQMAAGGESCSAFGFQAGFWNGAGDGNSAFGSNALLNTRTGSWNSGLGINALYTNQTGSHNVSCGLEALYSAVADNNTGIGSNSGYHLAGASTNNICIGYIAGKFHADGSTALTTASNSCYLGAGSRGLNNSDSNSIVIGSSAIGIGANKTVIGTSSTTETKLFGSVSLTGDTVNVATQKTPASATATGTKGDIVHDTNYIYVCTAANTWKRALLSTW